MANTINTVKDGPGLFAKGVAQRLRDNLKFCGFVDQADPSEFDGKNQFKAGDTIYTSIPTRKIAQRDNLDITSKNKDVTEEKAPLVLNKTATDADEFDSLELATDVDVANALKRFGMPAADTLAHEIESRCMEIASDATYNFTGTAGSNAFAISDVLAAKTALDESLCPMGDRMLFMNSRSGAEAVDARKGLFQSSEEIAKQYRDGYIGRADGFDWVETQLVPTHTNGSDMDPAAVNDAAVAEGASTLAFDGLGAGTDTIKKGTVFTIAGVNKVHPITKADLGVLQQFVVTADVTASGGAGTMSISPSIYAGSEGLQNVTALPADDAVITFGTGSADTTYTQNLALHKSAFKMVTVPMYQPRGVDLVASETVDGITVNIVRDYEQNTRKIITRYDVLYAFDPVRPEWSTRLTA
jgi:hypothetical protein